MFRRFCPQLVIPSVTVLTPDFFRTRGLSAALLDLDNTLVQWHGDDVQSDVAEWLQDLKAAGLRFCLASNTHRPRRLAALGEALGVPYEMGVAKPWPAGLRRCLSRLEASPAETAMIGDQIFTDVWGGNRCGLFTILVRPMSPREFIGTRVVSRPLEKVVLSSLRRQGLIREDLSMEVTR
jgi:HAD superfamily phosphatase (TIGR01668 family)